ncbi:MAG TPA: hypothetical protein VE863_20670 [Pyrinomonadaceae bacterium]|jgi:hypothetical protein|nr:hypothetical protein [Pyrinomonadaceae bacterium]
MRKKINSRYLTITILGLFFLLALGVIAYLMGRVPVNAQPGSASFSFVRYTGVKPFKLNTLPTTMYGPAWADVVVQPSNMLTCKSEVPIALCYYSGPQGTVPCNQDGLGIANCTCYEIPPGKLPYMVDINGILNQDVYLKTVAKCGQKGDKCGPGTTDIPVCDAINNNALIPGADLISTFSLALEKQMPIHETNCPNPSAYAGCMTAPCKRTGKIDPKTHLPLVQCGCPVYTGPYQVGTAPDQCVLDGTYVWSAAYNPKLNR